MEVLPEGYTWSTYEPTKENCTIIADFLSNNYVEDKMNKFRLCYSSDFIHWYLNSTISINVVIMDNMNTMVGFISGRKITMKLKDRVEGAAEIDFLCLSKNNRNNKLCPLLIKEITRQFNNIGIYEAIYTSTHMYQNLLSSVNYFIRPINIKYLVDIDFLKATTHPDNLERMYMLPKVKSGNKTLLQLTNDNCENYINQCYDLYNKYMNKFECYEIMDHILFKKMLINDHIRCYVLLENNKVLDFISYYTFDTLVLRKNKTMRDGYMYLYTNTSDHLHKMLLMFLHTLKDNMIDSFLALDIMENEDDMYEDLNFVKESSDFYYFLFKDTNLKIKNKKLAKIIF